MKKTLVAVAALAAVFGAQAQATISGLVEAGILMPNQGANSMASGGNGGSEITITAGEELGSGLKATAAVTFINNPFAAGDGGAAAAATPTIAENAVKTYNSFIGLSGEFGSVKLGNQFTPGFFAANVGDAFGQAAGTFNLAGTTGGGAQGSGHAANTITYTSPSMSGVAISYQSSVDSSSVSYSVTYSAGALTAAYGSQENGATTQTHFAANYDFGMAKLFFASKSETDQADASGFGISAPVGPVVLVASMSTRSGDEDNNNFGIVYPLSKRTSLALVNYNGGSAAARGNFLGVRHTF